MIASRVVYPPNGPLDDPQPRAVSPTIASSPPTRIRTSGIFTRRLSLTAASVANSVSSSSFFGTSPPAANSGTIYQQSSFFRSSTTSFHNSNTVVAASSSTDVSSSANNISNSTTMSSSPPRSGRQTTVDISSGRSRSRSTSHPPPPKYKTYRTPQLRISLQDVAGNLVLSAPVMAPGESIRGQIHLELPKATPVHSIEVCLTGTVTALDGTRLGSMKTVTILDECKTVATASITNTRTNTTRRHTTPSSSTTTPASTAAGTITSDTTTAAVGRSGRRTSVSGNSMAVDRSRSPTFPATNGVVATTSGTPIGHGNSRRLSAELMSRTLSMPSSQLGQGYHNNVSTLSLNNRPVSPTPADLRGRRTSFSANVDVPIDGFNSLLGGRGNMSMVNISSISQFPLNDGPDPSEPEAPSYDPPQYEGIFASSNPRSSSSTTDNNEEQQVVESPTFETPAPAMASSSSVSSTTVDEPTSTPVSDPLSEISETATPVSTPVSAPSPSNSSDDVRTQSSRSSRDSQSNPSSVSTPASSTSTPVEPVEPKAVLMQPGNYVIPFSIRIPSNSVMSLPGSFTDPVGTISYQLKAVMKQILPSPDPYNPRALIVEPTYTSATQVIKLIPMNDPTYMPLYSTPFETESVRANVGHWVWSTGFLEAHAWVPKKGYRPGRIVPLVIHIVNHSDARQIVVETTLCKCLHYGSGLSAARAMGIAGQGYLFDPTLNNAADIAIEEGDVLANEEDSTTPTATVIESRRRSGRRNSSNQNNQQQSSTITSAIPSPPASPYGSNFPSTPTSEHGDSPEGSIRGVTASTERMASQNSMASISSQWGSIHSNSSDGTSNSNSNGTGQVASAIQAYNNLNNAAVNSSGSIQNSLDTLRASMVASPTPSAKSTVKEPALPIVQHQREKLTKSRTLINCSLAVDREIQKTIPVLIPPTAGYSILNAPLLEVSYEIVIKIRAEKNTSTVVPVPRRRQGGARLSVPIVVVVPEDGDLEDEEEELLLASAGISADMLSGGLGGGLAGMSMASLGLAGTTFSGDEMFEYGDQGECPPYEATASSASRRRTRRR
ncbi:Arrestin domain-containing protein 3 [Linnemannia zychae]|nr:Arrestin domain-containing protein 3 [Linnemannia zychae]